MNIENLFPLEGEITQEIIYESVLLDVRKCIGALTLLASLEGKIDPVSSDIAWGVHTGLNKINGQVVRITTKEDVNMMEIKKPQKVTFIIHEIL